MKSKQLKPSEKSGIEQNASDVMVNNIPLINDIRSLIAQTRLVVAATVNAGLTMLYWKIGQRINNEILKNRRAEYGQEIITALSAQLVVEYGEGFNEKNLQRMRQFAECFRKEPIVVTLSRQLSWSHFVALVPVHDPLARDFYAEMCRIEHWGVHTLRKKIGGMLFQRTALSKNTKEVIAAELGNLRAGRVTPETIFRDPYILDCLGLKGTYSERDLESAILREMEGFLLEMGPGFSFVARQKRMSVGKDDFHLDLLFYHRHLRRLVAIELKLESFQPAHVGQMEFYLHWLDKHERAPGEESPIGMILCASADAEQVELCRLDTKDIRVSEYLTELPPMALLQTRLHQAIAHAREQAVILRRKQD